MSEDSKSKIAPKSDSTSPARNTEQEIKNYTGTLPPKKSVEQIDRQNLPSGRGKAPGSTRI
jgi:hypothetical protein